MTQVKTVDVYVCYVIFAVLFIAFLVGCGRHVFVKKLNANSVIDGHQIALIECEDREEFLNRELDRMGSLYQRTMFTKGK